MKVRSGKRRRRQSIGEGVAYGHDLWAISEVASPQIAVDEALLELVVLWSAWYIVCVCVCVGEREWVLSMCMWDRYRDGEKAEATGGDAQRGRLP